jgi:hypothetical protein
MQQLEGDNRLSFNHLRDLLYASPRATNPNAAITSAQHAVAACLELNNEVHVEAPCIEVPVKGFTASWKRAQPYWPPDKRSDAATKIILASERFSKFPKRRRVAIHSDKKQNIRVSSCSGSAGIPPESQDPESTENHATCFLYEQRGTRKQVQLRYARRSLIHPRVLPAASPIRIYSVPFGYTP